MKVSQHPIASIILFDGATSNRRLFRLSIAMLWLAASALGNKAAAQTTADACSYVFTTHAGAGPNHDLIGTPLRAPSGVAVDNSGDLYIADTDNHAIRKVTSSGLVLVLAGSVGKPGNTDGRGSAARFYYPKGVAVDQTGNVYVADTANHTVRKVTPDGLVTTFAGLPGVVGNSDGAGDIARFYYPSGIATDRVGNVYVADTFNSTIRRVSPAGVVRTLA